jgi:peptidoglycan/xylan/chitin deacetylase (PgdA/CDA1 family)
MRQYYNIVLAAAVTAVLALLFFNIFSDRYKEREYNSSFEWPEGKKMGLSLTFDDGRNSQIDKGIPLFDKYGVKGTFYVSTQNIIGRTEKWRRAFATIISLRFSEMYDAMFCTLSIHISLAGSVAYLQMASRVER